MTEPRLIRDMSVERRDDLIAQVWAFLSDRGYTITPPGVVSLETRLADMTREARLSREATEKAVASRIARHEIERALRAVDVYDDVASDEDVIFHDGAMHAVRIIRDMLELDR